MTTTTKLKTRKKADINAFLVSDPHAQISEKFIKDLFKHFVRAHEQICIDVPRAVSVTRAYMREKGLEIIKTVEVCINGNDHILEISDFDHEGYYIYMKHAAAVYEGEISQAYRNIIQDIIFKVFEENNFLADYNY